MHKIFILSLIFVLSGCGVVTFKEIEVAIEKCAPHGGIAYMIVTQNQNESSARCKDGTKITTNYKE